MDTVQEFVRTMIDFSPYVNATDLISDVDFIFYLSTAYDAQARQDSESMKTACEAMGAWFRLRP